MEKEKRLCCPAAGPREWQRGWSCSWPHSPAAPLLEPRPWEPHAHACVSALAPGRRPRCLHGSLSFGSSPAGTGERTGSSSASRCCYGTWTKTWHSCTLRLHRPHPPQMLHTHESASAAEARTQRAHSSASSGVSMGVTCCGPLSGSLHTHHLPEEGTAPHQAFSEGICQHHGASSLTPPPAQRNRGNSNKLLRHPKQTSSSGYACCPCPPPPTPVISRRTLAPPLPAPRLRREPRRDARPRAPPLPAPREQLISFRCYYCVVMVNLPTPPIRGARMGEAVIRVNLIRSRFI